MRTPMQTRRNPRPPQPTLCGRTARVWRRVRPLVGFVVAVAAAVLAAIATGSAYAQGYGYADVVALARAEAARPYEPPEARAPAPLAALDYDGYRKIRFRPARALWRDERLPFELMLMHLGAGHVHPVALHEVSAAGVRPIGFDASMYDYGDNALQPAGWGDIGHAGFRIHYALHTASYKDELVVFLGASYFRAVGRGQQYGLSARGLAIDTTGAAAEEFPRFKAFWLVKPQPGATALTIYALLDSPRSAGAYQFTLHPGENTAVDVRATVYLRAGVATLGIAPLTSMYHHGENQPDAADFRPEVHDSDGLSIAAGAPGRSVEWLWRPLVNPSKPVATSFAVDELKGFGLMQRDRSYATYEDLEARYHRRPSAWVEPLSDWGPGRVELLQLPTPDETHDNIVAYWMPRTLPAPGEPLDLAWRVSWQGDSPQRPPHGWTVQSRRGRGWAPASAPTDALQFVVDFAGPALDALSAGAAVEPVVTADDNGRLLETLAYRNDATGGWRMTLRVRHLDRARPLELRAFLRSGPVALTETWTSFIPAE